MLFRHEAFEPLTDEPWDASRVRTRIQAIVDSADRAFDAHTLWPAHPGDLWENVPPPVKGVFAGAAGVVLALDALRTRIGADVRTDLAAAAQRAAELMHAESDLAAVERAPEPRDSSLLVGSTGVLLVACSLASAPEIADRLFDLVNDNLTNDVDELMWGIPGTMLAARAMHSRTGESRWLEAWQAGADALRARRDADGLWTQHFGNHSVRYLGPVHGAVGNTHALLDEDVEPLVATLAARAVVEDGLVNWPPDADGPFVHPRDGAIRLQWCHGAPGIVATTAPFLPLDLLLSAAELIWRAGAHRDEKGAGLCHGTAGNGYALLKTFERTGDELWLDRARRFAVHALEQADMRYSLFTGAVGVALFAADCIDARARYPIMDSLSG